MENPRAEEQKGHETTDAQVRPIVVFLLVLAALIFVAMLCMAWLLDVFQLPEERAGAVPAGLTDSQQIPPTPRLQAYPAADLQRLRAAEEKKLTSYEWVDEATGVMRIPISRAIDILAENGLPARPSAEEGGLEGTSPP